MTHNAARGECRLAVASAILLTTALISTYGAHGPSHTRLLARVVQRPVPCLDLPVSSALVAPLSCWLTGPTSMIVTGTAPGQPNEGVIDVIAGQGFALSRLPGSGALHISEVNSGTACVEDDGHRFLSLELATGNVSTKWASQCVSPVSLASSGLTTRLLSSTVASGSLSPPATTASYYEYQSYLSECSGSPGSGCPAYQQGYSAYSPASGGVVVLDFGAPCYVPGSSPTSYGVQIFGDYTSCYSDRLLLPIVEQWIAGYEAGHGAGTTPITLALGTSNSLTAADPPSYSLSSAQMQASGAAWYSEVVGAVSTLGLVAPIVVWGASDMEESTSGNWYSGPLTDAWVQGFGQASPARSSCSTGVPGFLADYGDDILGASGAIGADSSGGPWTVQDVYLAAYGTPVACAVPEIYNESMASEWAALSAWGPGNGYWEINFTGAMAEASAGTLTPSQAWVALQQATAQTPAIQDVTTIGSALQTPPSPQSGGGVVLDGWGGLHPFGTYTLDTTGAPYWPGWDIARSVQLMPGGVGGWVLDGWGGVHPFGDAPSLGIGPYWPGWSIAESLVVYPNSTGGYSGYVLDGYGGIHPIGGAPPLTGGPYWPGFDVARGLILSFNSAGVPDGGTVLDAWGGLHPFGAFSEQMSLPYYPGRWVYRSLVSVGTAAYTVGQYGVITAAAGALTPDWTGYSDWGSWAIESDVVLASASGGWGESQPVSAAAQSAYNQLIRS